MVWAEHIVINIKMNKIKDPHQILQVWFSSSFPIGSYRILSWFRSSNR